MYLLKVRYADKKFSLVDCQTTGCLLGFIWKYQRAPVFKKAYLIGIFPENVLDDNDGLLNNVVHLKLFNHLSFLKIIREQK